MLFKDRKDAGQKLAEKLKKFKDKEDTVVLALPRGGVVLGYEVAKALDLPLDIVVPRKIGYPGNPEYAIGAITESGEAIFNQAAKAQVDPEWLENEIVKEQAEAKRRLKLYRGDKSSIDLKNKTVLIVDDGIATGLTMLAAIKSTRQKKPRQIIVAVPVMARDSLPIIAKQADQVIYLDAPLYFGAVGAFYDKFEPTTDHEVIKLLKD